MATEIFNLCDEYVTRLARLDPIWATFRGVAGSHAAGTDYGPDGVAARAELARETLQRLSALTGTGPADEAAAAHLRERLGAELAGHELGEPYRLVRAPFGMIQSIRDSVELLPRTDDEAWRAVAARLAAVPTMLSSWRAGLVEGIGRGLVAARRQAVESAAQADRYAGLDGTPATHAAMLESYRESHGDGPLSGALAAATAAAHAGYADTARWLHEEYAPRAAESDGVGRERYAVASRFALGADIDPVDAYEWGWAELRRIEAEMAGEAGKVRPGTGVDEAITWLDETDVIDGTEQYRTWLQDRHDEAIARLHGTHFDIAEPLRRVEVTLVASSSAGAPYYTPPKEDMTRPGRTWWPLGGRNRFSVWAELTTVFHEGVPGHHLQLGAARVAGDRLSRFSRVAGVSGHSEGWALYAERLADELGWFSTPGQRLGMLKASALRAARVVIDIGVHLDLPLPGEEAARHGPRWTFDVATEVLRDRGRLAAHRVHPEIVRYFGWPGQAISYKLGERAWLAARDEARTRLGAAFDLKDWHTRALALGSVGLGALARALRRASG